MKMPACSKRILILLACVLTIAGCTKKSPAPTDKIHAGTAQTEASFAKINDEQASVVFAQGTDALASTRSKSKNLTEAIHQFLSSPTDENLKNAQQWWGIATIEYRRFSFYRHLGLVDPTSFAALNRLDYQISGYPIQPGFIDTFGPYKYSGLVHDIGFPITEESLVNQHGLTDLADIVLGFYAIEFLLFNSGEERKASDFTQITTIDDALKERGFEKIEEIPANRRRELLSQQAQILNADLKRLEEYWSNRKEGFQKQWQTFSDTKRTNTVLTAISSALTQVMIEIGELNQEKNTNTYISSGIYTSDINNQKKFIHYAVDSIKSGSTLLVSDKTHPINTSLSQALSLTNEDIQTEEKDRKEHWRTIFSSIKSASDHLNKKN